MTYGSLFSGVGGIDLGLDRAGFTCRWQIENEPYAIKVLEKHWPHVKRYGDITRVNGSELEPVDLICGGFPCQDLSQAGKQAGIEGTRSGLWFEYARLVRELGPKYVLIENVAGLLVSDAMRRVVGELARLGYVGCWRSLRASEFGASHLRKRVFIVAYRDGGGSALERIGGIFDGERTSRGHDADGRDPHVAHGNGRGLLDAIDGRECGAGDGEAQSAGNIADVEHAIDRGLQGRRAGGSEPLCERRSDDVRYAPAESGGIVAHGKSGGLGELGEPSGRDGLSDGSNEELEDAARDEQPGLQGETGRLRGRGVREAGDSLAHGSTSRRARREDAGTDSGDERADGRGRIEPERDSRALAHTECAERGTHDEHEQLRAERGEASDRFGCNGLHVGDTSHQLHNGSGDAGATRWRESPDDGGYLADTRNGLLQEQGRGPEGRDGVGSGSENLGHTERTRLEERDGQREQQLRQDAESLAPGLPDGELAHAARDNRRLDSIPDPTGANSQRGRVRTGSGGLQAGDLSGIIRDMQFAPGPSDARWPAILASRPDLAPALESPVRGVAPRLPDFLDGAMSNRTKRLGRLGNSVVPQIAEWLGARIQEFDLCQTK